MHSSGANVRIRFESTNHTLVKFLAHFTVFYPQAVAHTRGFGTLECSAGGADGFIEYFKASYMFVEVF